MHVKTAFLRAARAMREDLKLHLVSLSSLTIAFLCLATALFLIGNLAGVADAWGRSARMSVYLSDGAEADEIAQLRLLLEGLAETESVEQVTSAEARAQFLEDAEVGPGMEGLSADAFPASLEVRLAQTVSARRMRQIAERIAQFNAVDDVETYHGWLDSLESLIATGRVASGVFGGLVLLCVLFVIANTIRLAIAGRREEIEVLKLCGASNGFVRGPFLVEGAVQGFVSAFLAVLFLFVAFMALRPDIDATVGGLAGVHTVFLSPAVVLSLLLGGTAVGAAGSAISLRRYLGV